MGRVMADDLLTEILTELGRLQRYAAGLHGLIGEAQAQAPRDSAGTDPTGTVHAVLGPDGLPTRIDVDHDWARRLAPETVGSAVLEACQAAAGARLAACHRRLDHDAWRARVDQLRDALGAPEHSHPTDVPVAYQGPDVRPRALESVTEDLLAAFDRAAATANRTAGAAVSPLSTTVTSTDTSGRLTVTLAQAGLVACTAEPQWAAHQDGRNLARAVEEALAAARTNLAQAVAATSDPRAELDGLFDEALAMLRDPARFADRQET